MKAPFLDHFIRGLCDRIRSRFKGRKPSDCAEAAPLPLDVLAELIDNLYAPLGSLLVSTSCGLLVGATISWRTGDHALYGCTVAMALVSAYLVTLALLYRAEGSKRAHSAEALRRWDWRYALGGVAYAACLGTTCFIAFVSTDDPISHLLVDAITTGYTAGVTARNSARIKTAVGQLTVTLVPLALAALVRGGPAYSILGFITLLYWFAAIEIALHLSQRKLRLLLLNLENKSLATTLAEQNRRLDIAMRNMSHGLCMFDAQARLVVSNERMCELFDLPAGSLTPGMTVAEMATNAVNVGSHADHSAAEAIRDYELNLAKGSMHSKVRLNNGRMISWSQQALSDGGAVVICEDITERENVEAKARYLSTHDGLTGLPNRLLFDQILDHAVKVSRRYQEQFCVMFIDLDRFKFINDSLGHSAGDLLLKDVATRLRNCVRESDVVARFGGDEFVMILYDVANAKQAESVARKIVQSVAVPITIYGQERTTSASVGIAIFPQDATDQQSLIKCADAAMYKAKQEGKDNFRFYSSDIKTQSVERLQLENELRHALQRDELVIYYQAKRYIATGAISGVEALLRWRHPDRGLLSPIDFISLAEETGLLVPIGKWVTETACAQIMGWQALGLPAIRIAINLSPRQLMHENLLGDIEDALQKSGLPANLLELEITESMLMHDLDRTEQLLRAIRIRGVRVAIDDFGAGYSSLSRLKRLPIDTLKIDPSFVRGILTDAKDRAMTKAILTLGLALDLTVVGEGVETKEQELFLHKHGCHQMQGFLFSKPIPGEDFVEFAGAYDMKRLGQLSDEMRQKVTTAEGVDHSWEPGDRLPRDGLNHLLGST